MSEKDIEQEAPVEEPAVVEPDAKPSEAKKPKRERSGNSVAWLAFLVALIALAASGYLAWQDWQSAGDTSTDDSVARLDGRIANSAQSLADLEAQVAELGERDPGIDARSARFAVTWMSASAC